MKEETLQKMREAAKRRSEESRKARIHQSVLNARFARESRERRKQIDEFKLICREGPHKTEYRFPTEELALNRLDELKDLYKNPHIVVYCDIYHCVGYSRKLIKKFEIRCGLLTNLEV